MNISDAKLWASASGVAERILSCNDKLTFTVKGSVQSLLMLAYMEGRKDAKDDQKSIVGKG